MTPEREQVARSVARVDGITDTSLVRDLLAEIDRLRALPVLRTCGECGRYGRAEAEDGHGPCYDERAAIATPDGLRPAATVANAAPPSWCPLRGGAR